MGLFGPSKEEKEKAEKLAKEKIEKSKLVKVTTGDIKEKYEILKIVFQLGADSGGVFGSLLGTGGSPEAAFAHAETQLKIKASELGCNYVINTVFNQRVAVSSQKTVTGSYNQVIEVFAYGTAVKTI